MPSTSSSPLTRGLFPPPQNPDKTIRWDNKSKRNVRHVTRSGPVDLYRTAYWAPGHGTHCPADYLLGIVAESYSVGVRELACELGIEKAFVPADRLLEKSAGIRIPKSPLRELVLREGSRAEGLIRQGSYGPGWTWEDCVDHTVAVGSDGVMVPCVTEVQKRKRRKKEAEKQQAEGRRSTRNPGRPRKGTDNDYKEFKIASFYDSDKSHSYAVGTSGNHEVLGRMMRREAAKIGVDKAAVSYSVTDGGEWIAKQLAKQLPMLHVNVLDYYHLRDHVIRASHVLYGEGTKKAVAWREELLGLVWERGSLVMLDKLANFIRRHRSGEKHKALKSLQQYVAKRVDMTDYPSFRDAGLDCGSGPTESFCGCLTRRLKGRGMRWDRDNAESIMALGSLYYSNLWTDYWKQQRAA